MFALSNYLVNKGISREETQGRGLGKCLDSMATRNEVIFGEIISIKTLAGVCPVFAFFSIVRLTKVSQSGRKRRDKRYG